MVQRLSVRARVEPDRAAVHLRAGRAERGRPPDRHAARGPPRRGGHAARARRAARGRAALDRASAASPLSSLPRVRQLRIQDTLSGEVVPVESSEPGRIGIYACGPTVYGRIHVGNARPVRRLLAAEALPRARGLRLVARDQHHRRERQDLRRRPRARRAERGARARDDRRVRGGHRPARPRPPRPRAEGHRDDRRDHRPDRGARGVRSRLRARRRRLLPRGLLSRLRQALEPPAGGDAAGRGRRRRRAEGVAAGLRALEGAQGGRGHLVGVALGRGPARLAHRVLGHGRGRARHPVRGARRRLGPRLPAPRERDRADRGGARQAAGPHLDAQRHGADGRREDGEVGRATSGCCTARSSSSGATPS